MLGGEVGWPATVVFLLFWVLKRFAFSLLPCRALFWSPPASFPGVIAVLRVSIEKRIMPSCLDPNLLSLCCDILSLKKNKNKPCFEAYTVCEHLFMCVCMYVHVCMNIYNRAFYAKSPVTIAFIDFLMLFPIVLDLPVLMKWYLDHKGLQQFYLCEWKLLTKYSPFTLNTLALKITFLFWILLSSTSISCFAIDVEQFVQSLTASVYNTV